MKTNVKSKKSLGKMILSVAMLAILIGSLGTGVAKADWTTRSTDFWFDYTTANPYDYSEEQDKHNASSSYAYYEIGPYNVDVSVIGCDGTLRDDIYAPTYTFTPGMSYGDIHNFVNENGISQAILRASASYDQLFDAHFQWSADTY